MDLPIYCINLNHAKNRKDRMLNRFNYHGLTQQVHFDSVLRDFHKYPITDIVRSEAACLVSHLKAIKEFLKTNKDQVIICEDDIMLHNNFRFELNKLSENIPETFSLISFGIRSKS